MGEITKVDDHMVQVLELLISFYKDATNLQTLLEVMVEEANELEDTWYSLFAECTLEEAIGAQLDQWGSLVGQPRPDGLSDADYRKLISVKIEANLSESEVWRMGDIAEKLMGTAVEYFQHGRASFTLAWTIGAPSTAAWMAVVIGVIEFARPAGVEMVLIEGIAPVFRFDSGPGYDQGKLAQRWY